jgi:hypothetical protein
VYHQPRLPVNNYFADPSELKSGDPAFSVAKIIDPGAYYVVSKTFVGC